MLDDRKWEGNVMAKIIQKNGLEEKQKCDKECCHLYYEKKRTVQIEK
jgi:hypothetical protein